MTTCTEIEALALLARRIAGAGGRQKFAEMSGVEVSELDSTLDRKQPISDKVLQAIGLCRIKFNEAS
jgi:hypothetical protein